MEKMKLKVIGFSNINDEGYKNYVASLDKFGYDYKILGKGMKWNGFVNTKIRCIYKYLLNLQEENISNESIIVCITDVNDMIACCNEKELIDKFLSFNAPIVIGSEQPYLFVNCVKEQRLLYDPNIKRVYCNGGFYIGYLPNIIQMYKFILDYSKKIKTNDDQLCLGYYNINHDGHELDTQSKLVYNIALESYKKVKNRILCEYSNEYPCFVHMIGKLYINDITKTILKTYQSTPLYKIAFDNLKRLRQYFKDTYFKQYQVPLFIFIFIFLEHSMKKYGSYKTFLNFVVIIVLLILALW